MDSRGLSATYQRSRGSASGSSCALLQLSTQRCALCPPRATLIACRPQTRWRRSSRRSIGSGDLGPASLPVVEAEQLRSRLGDGAARWVAGAVEQSLAALHVQIHDSLAPWPIIRTFAQHVLTVTLLRLAGEESPPADTDAIDRDLAEDIVARDIPLSEITHALRSMQHEWLSLLIDAAVGVGPDGVGVVPALATSVTGTMDAWIGAATDAIVEERRRVYLAEQVRIRSAIEALVTAEPVDIAAATQLLRIPLIGWHVSCAIGATAGRAGRAPSTGSHCALVRPGRRQRTHAAIRSKRGDGAPLGDHRSSATDTPRSRSRRGGADARRHW